MVQTHIIKRNSKRPSVPGSRKAEGAKNLRTPKSQFNVCTYNVRTLKDRAKEEELESELKESGLKWDVIGIAETRRTGERLEELESGHVLYTKNGETSMGGVGFLVNKKIKDSISEYEGTSNRVASITLKINRKYRVQIIQVYAPTTSHDDEEVEQLYEEVTKAIERNNSHYKIVMDDF